MQTLIGVKLSYKLINYKGEHLLPQTYYEKTKYRNTLYTLQ